MTNLTAIGHDCRGVTAAAAARTTSPAAAAPLPPLSAGPATRTCSECSGEGRANLINYIKRYHGEEETQCPVYQGKG